MDPFGSNRQTPTPEKPDYRDRLDRLERDLRQLQIEFEKFFSGALPIPPEDFRERLRAELRRLRTSRMSSAEIFRLNGLEARFNSYGELFNRRLREQEEGRAQRAKVAPAPAAAYDVWNGVRVSQGIEPAAVEALYAGLCRGDRPPKFDLSSFDLYLKRQLDVIRRKGNVAQVEFRLEDDGGKIRLKAKPLRSPEGS